MRLSCCRLNGLTKAGFVSVLSTPACGLLLAVSFDKGFSTLMTERPNWPADSDDATPLSMVIGVGRVSLPLSGSVVFAGAGALAMMDTDFVDAPVFGIGLAFAPTIEKGLAGVMAVVSPEPFLGLNSLTFATESFWCSFDDDGLVVDKMDFPLGVIDLAVFVKTGICFGAETAFGRALGRGRSKPVPSVFSPAKIGWGIVSFFSILGVTGFCLTAVTMLPSSFTVTVSGTEGNSLWF